MKRIRALFATMMFLASWSLSADQQPSRFVVSPIGFVRFANEKTTIVLNKEYQPALLGLDGFSHIHVYWWFDRNDTPEKRSTLQIHPNPPGNTDHPLTGVFATRSPYRPNLIGMTLCRIIGVKDNVVEIDRIDAFPDTPVLDIKPYVPRLDSVPSATVPGWMQH